MNSPRTAVVVLAAGLLLGLSATVLAQGGRPNEGTAPPAGGSATGDTRVGGAGANFNSGSPGGGPAGAGSGGGSTWSGNSGGSNTGGNGGFGGNGSPAWGGSTPNVRPRDAVSRQPGGEGQGAGRDRGYSAGSNQVPWYSRPRGGDIPTTGTAIPRSQWNASNPPGSGGGGSYDSGLPNGFYPWWGYVAYPGWGTPYSWYLYPRAFGAYGYGYADYCANGGYDIGALSAFRSPFTYPGCGYYGGGSYGASDWGSGGAPSSYYPQATGGLRLKVTPVTARVYVDGYFAGLVSQFDGRFQKLSIRPGAHKIEVSAPGFTPAVFDIEVKDSEVIVWEGNLEKIK